MKINTLIVYRISLKQLVLGFALLCCARISIKAQDRVLLIGIDKYQNLKQAAGAENDTKILKEFLKSEYFFKEEQITVLLNEKATRVNIIKELDRLVKNSSPGSRIFFSFSGHGTQQIDTSNKEFDRQEKAIVPSDAYIIDKVKGIGNLVLSSEIKKRFMKLSDRRLVALFDCCYAGTIARSLQEEAYSRFILNPQFLLPENRKLLLQDDSELINDNILRDVPLETENGYLVYFYACKPEQKAFPVKTYLGQNGLLTYSFCNTFKKGKTLKEAAEELSGFAKNEIRKSNKNINQDPYCEAGYNILSKPLYFKIDHLPEQLFSTNLLNEKSAYDFRVATRRGGKVYYFQEVENNGKKEIRGDEIRFLIKSNKKGYLYLFLQDRITGKWAAVLPGKDEFYPLSAGINYFPGENDRFSLDAAPPEGPDRLLFLIVTDPAVIDNAAAVLGEIDSSEKIRELVRGIKTDNKKGDWQAAIIEVIAEKR